MRDTLLSYLACPQCGGEVRLLPGARRTGNHVIDGELEAACCARRFAIRGGVPRFVQARELSADKAATAESFGWEWQVFDRVDPRYERQFLGWIGPVEPAFFAGKAVLEGGCGKGRHTRLAAGWGARAIVSIDLSDAVDVAFAATRDAPDAHIVQADIYRMPFKRTFDYAFSVGVLHHLPDPRAGFESLASRVVPGGHVSAWVYGAENNEWITRLVDPVRTRLTSRMDKRALFSLSRLPAAAVFAATRLVYGPLNASTAGRRIARHLFYNDYLAPLSRFGFAEQHHIVFDQLVAPTAFYIPRAEFESWWTGIGAEEVVVGHHQGNSWRGFGRIPFAGPTV